MINKYETPPEFAMTELNDYILPLHLHANPTPDSIVEFIDYAPGSDLRPKSINIIVPRQSLANHVARRFGEDQNGVSGVQPMA